MAGTEQRILILAPTGRDANLAADVLRRAELEPSVCASVEALCDRIREGAGAVLLVEEALSPTALGKLQAVLETQPAWSDLPIIVFSSSGRSEAWASKLQELLGVLGNVTIIERPVRMGTLVTALRAALRARERQYSARRTLLRIEQEELAARERADFEQHLIGIVSHDLRNPIAAMLLGVETLMRREDLSPHVTQRLVRISSSGQRAVRLIRDLLDFTQARIGGGIRLELREADLGAIAQQVVDELQTTSPEREIRFFAEGSFLGLWDADRLSQVLANLTSNALAYSPKDTPVTIALTSNEREVRLSVHNLGDPIPAPTLQTLFEPYKRGDETSSGGARNIGLGLFIVQALARAHGGTVTVRSSAQEGTLFCVTLPRSPAAR